MPVETLERPRTNKLQFVQRLAPRVPEPTGTDEPNFGPEDIHAIKAIAYIMVGIFTAALVMYGAIAIFAT